MSHKIVLKKIKLALLSRLLRESSLMKNNFTIDFFIYLDWEMQFDLTIVGVLLITYVGHTAALYQIRNIILTPYRAYQIVVHTI